MCKLNLIDFDGTFILNDELLIRLFSEEFKKVYNLINHSVEYIIDINKKYYKTDINKIYEHFGQKYIVGDNKIWDNIRKIYPSKYMDKITINYKLLHYLGLKDINMIVSHSPESVISSIVESHNLKSIIDDIITPHENDIKYKPAPDLYLAAIAKSMEIGKSFSHINIFEDSDWGFISGLEVGNLMVRGKIDGVNSITVNKVNSKGRINEISDFKRERF